MSLSIVIPCHNEEASIEAVVRGLSLAAARQDPDFEILVIDDGSVDGTPAILEAIGRRMPELRVLRNERNLGHGRSIRRGYETAQKEKVFQTDSDGQFDPEELEHLLREFPGNDIVLGFRRHRKDPLIRNGISGLLSLLILGIFGKRVRDANCPFRLMRRVSLVNLLKLIPPDSSIPNILIVAGALYKGYKVRQIPVTHFSRTTGQVSLRGGRLLKLCFQSVAALIEFRRTLHGCPR